MAGSVKMSSHGPHVHLRMPGDCTSDCLHSATEVFVYACWPPCTTEKAATPSSPVPAAITLVENWGGVPAKVLLFQARLEATAAAYA